MRRNVVVEKHCDHNAVELANLRHCGLGDQLRVRLLGRDAGLVGVGARDQPGGFRAQWPAGAVEDRAIDAGQLGELANAQSCTGD